MKSRDPNIFKHIQDKAGKLAESLNIDEEIKNFLNNKGIMKQEVQQEPDQDQQEFRSVVPPYALYESDTHYTIVAYIPGVTSKKQLSVGMDDEQLLVIEVEGSLYDSDNNKYGKLIRSSWPLGFDIKIPLPTKVNPSNEVAVNVEYGITELFIKKSGIMLKIV